MKIIDFRKTSLLLATVALLAMMVAPSFAALQTEDSATRSPSSGTYLTRLYPQESYGGGLSAKFFTFNASKGGYISNVTVQMRRQGTTDMYVRAYISYLDAAAYTAKPNGTLVDTSINTVSANDLSTTWTNASFYFGATQQLTAGTKYGVIIGVAGWTYPTLPTTSDCIVTGTASHVHPTCASHDGSAPNWSTPSSTADFYFIIESSTEADVGGLPEDWGPSSTNYDEIIADFTTFMVPLVVTLLPAFLLIFLTKRSDKWLLLIGLVIGAGLGFYFGLVPLWVVFLVTIGLIGMAYQSVRGGG